MSDATAFGGACLPRNSKSFSEPFGVLVCGEATSDCATIDKDNDGFNLCKDCNDLDDAIHPDAVELPMDGVDQNCNRIDARCSVERLGPHVVQLFDGYGDCFDQGTPCGSQEILDGAAIALEFPEEAMCAKEGAAFWTGTSTQTYLASGGLGGSTSITLTGEFSYDGLTQCGYFSGTVGSPSGCSCELNGTLKGGPSVDCSGGGTDAGVDSGDVDECGAFTCSALGSPLGDVCTELNGLVHAPRVCASQNDCDDWIPGSVCDPGDDADASSAGLCIKQCTP